MFAANVFRLQSGSFRDVVGNAANSRVVCLLASIFSLEESKAKRNRRKNPIFTVSLMPDKVSCIAFLLNVSRYCILSTSTVFGACF